MEDLLHEERHAAKADGLLTLDLMIKALKLAPRTGWLDRGVSPLLAESVADHSFGVALMALVAALERQADGAALNPQRVLTLALIHDLAEAETGDWTPYDPRAIPEADDAARQAFLNHRHERNEERSAAKRAAEDAAMTRLLEALPDASRRELSGLWAELRDGVSAEAHFVKQVDRLETFLQSRRYLRDTPGLPIESFRQEVLETIDDPLLAAMRDAALDGGAQEDTDR